MRWESAENRFNEQQTAQGERWRSNTEIKKLHTESNNGRAGGKNTAAHTPQGSEKNGADKVGREKEKY